MGTDNVHEIKFKHFYSEGHLCSCQRKSLYRFQLLVVQAQQDYLMHRQWQVSREGVMQGNLTIFKASYFEDTTQESIGRAGKLSSFVKQRFRRSRQETLTGRIVRIFTYSMR